ncbi:MAG: lasso peptide biosynthesis PqqD family chaperone [Anaerolineae bacterium]|nr:lasso peptide biosynthesis PqqD family chaperone [Anaerolineae bacterium]
MSSPTSIQLHNTVQRSPDPVSSEIDDDLVILSVERGRYYSTQVVGQRIWALLAAPIRVDQICDALLGEFEVERPICEQEVITFLSQLRQEGLIEVA